MQGASLALAAVAALAAASSLSARQAPTRAASRPQRKGSRTQAAPGGSVAEGAFMPREVPAGYSASPLPLVRGTVLEEVVDPNETGEADEGAGLYHVTTNLPAVMADGRLRSRKELRRANRQGAGLGGGFSDDAAHLVSVGLRLDGALRLLRGMRLMALAVHGQIAPSDALDEFKAINQDVIDVLESAMGRMEQDMDDEGPVDDEDPMDDWGYGRRERVAIKEYIDEAEEIEARVLDSANGEHPGLDLYDALQGYERHLGSTVSDWIESGWIDEDEAICNSAIGFTERSTKFVRVNPDAIGLLQLAARVGAPADLVPEECELRLQPEDLAIVGVWGPAGRATGSAARMSGDEAFAKEVEVFWRRSFRMPFQPPFSLDDNHPRFGSYLAHALAKTEDQDTFIRIVNLAMKTWGFGDLRGIQRGEASLPSLPAKGTARHKRLRALYERLKAEPIQFRWSTNPGMAPGLRMGIVEERWLNPELGHISVREHPPDVDPLAGLVKGWCIDDMDRIMVGGAPAPPAPIFEVMSSRIERLLRGRGYGKLLYQGLIAALLERHPKGFYLIPNSCGSASTSPEAERVWANLRRELPSHGEVVFVPPGWRPRPSVRPPAGRP